MKYKRNAVLFIAKGVSTFGSLLFSFSLSFYILTVTGSGLSFTISLAIQFLPEIIISPFAGIFIDNFNKKIILILTDFLNALVVIR